MIEESLLKSNFLGKDGFIWWIGQVADPKSWRDDRSRVDSIGSWAYRCKVRIIGYHTFDGNVLPDDDLPWAHVLTSAADGSPGQGSFGKLPLLVGGESVLGFFLDGEEAQQPVVVACFYRNESVKNLISPELIQKEKSSKFKPFTGIQGKLADNPFTRMEATPDGTVKPVPSQINSPADKKVGAARTTGELKKDRLFNKDKADQKFNNQFKKTVTNENGCTDNLIVQIKNVLKDFIRFLNGLEETVIGFIDPVRNVIVDIQSEVRKVARYVASLFKKVINEVRSTLMRWIGNLLRDFIQTLPLSQHCIATEAAKNILDIIFCKLEELLPDLISFIVGLLNNLVGSVIAVSLCSVEEFLAALIAKLSQLIDGAISTVLSGIEWLVGAIGQLFDIVTGGLNTISRILSFLQCDSLTCETTVDWQPFQNGTILNPADSWLNSISNIDLFSGLGDTVDDWSQLISMFGSPLVPNSRCRESVVNPQNQNDIAVPTGTRLSRCIPPEVYIVGDGIDAQAIPVVSDVDGSILSFIVTNTGLEYTQPPTVTIVDNSGYGSGARARASISTTGNIESIYITSPGRGYCPRNLVGIGSTVAGIGSTTAGTGIATSSSGIGSTSIGISTTPTGIVTSIVIESPGYGYTSGDTISVGGCIYSPLLTENGSIIAVTESSQCQINFRTIPDVEINTTTGQGAVLFPVIQYTPTYIVDNPTITAGINTNRIISVVQCV